MATRCCCPPDRSPGAHRPCAAAQPAPAEPTRARGPASAPSFLSLRGANVTLSSTVRCGKRLKCWNTMPMRWRSSSGLSRQHRPAVEQDVALVGFVQPVERPQQRRLAGTGRPDHRGGGACGHVDVDAAEHRVGAEGQVHVVAGSMRLAASACRSSDHLLRCGGSAATADPPVRRVCPCAGGRRCS